MEKFATSTQLLPEQVWDQARPADGACCISAGRPAAAMPLMWAHAEYIKLLRSAADGLVFDLIPEVADRYRDGAPRDPIEVWKHNRQIESITLPCKLRIHSGEPFMLHWSLITDLAVHDTPLARRSSDHLPLTAKVKLAPAERIAA